MRQQPLTEPMPVSYTHLDTDGNIKPTEPKERKLLFIGDSITAGYGVNGEQSDTVFTTKTEDVTKAYPCLLYTSRCV